MPYPGFPMNSVARLSRLMSSIQRTIHRLVYDTPTRASLKSSYSTPAEISSSVVGLVLGSTVSAPAPKGAHFWEGVYGVGFPTKALPTVRYALLWQPFGMLTAATVQFPPYV